MSVCSQIHFMSPAVFGRSRHILMARTFWYTCIMRNFFSHLTSLPLTIPFRYTIHFVHSCPQWLSEPCRRPTLHSITSTTTVPMELHFPDAHVSIQVTPKDNSYSKVSSEPDVSAMTHTLQSSQQPIAPRLAYVTTSGRCIHRPKCKHLRNFNKPLAFCAWVTLPCVPTTHLIADTSDRVHLVDCTQAFSKGKCYTFCRDCWWVALHWHSVHYWSMVFRQCYLFGILEAIQTRRCGWTKPRTISHWKG